VKVSFKLHIEYVDIALANTKLGDREAIIGPGTFGVEEETKEPKVGTGLSAFIKSFANPKKDAVKTDLVPAADFRPAYAVPSFTAFGAALEGNFIFRRTYYFFTNFVPCRS